MKNNKKPFYGEKTKKKIVEEYLNSSATMDELAKLHGILGSNTVADWIRKYGNLSTKNGNKSIDMKKLPSSTEEKTKRSKRYKTDQHLYICTLESDLATTKQRLQFYTYSMSLLNEIAKEAFGIDLLKKIGGQLSNRSKQQKL